MNVLYIYADTALEWNTGHWRCLVPAKAIARLEGCHTHLINPNDWVAHPEVSEKADVIVISRFLIGNVLSAVEHWKARDKLVLLDLDDDYHRLPKNLPAYGFWNEGKLDQGAQMKFTGLQQLEWGAKQVHAIIAPTRLLCEDWRKRGIPAYQVHNWIDPEFYQVPEVKPHEGIFIGWGGSIGHIESFLRSGVVGALQAVLRKRPQVNLVIGNCEPVARAIQDWRRVTFLPWVNLTTWAKAESNFDIGLAPINGQYDRRRSWIKGLEYMLLGIPWVGTDAEPYEEMRGWSGTLVANNPKTWERALLSIVDHLEDCKAAAASQRSRVDGFSMAAHAQETVDLFERIRNECL